MPILCILADRLNKKDYLFLSDPKIRLFLLVKSALHCIRVFRYTEYFIKGPVVRVGPFGNKINSKVLR